MTCQRRIVRADTVSDIERRSGGVITMPLGVFDPDSGSYYLVRFPVRFDEMPGLLTAISNVPQRPRYAAHASLETGKSPAGRDEPWNLYNWATAVYTDVYQFIAR